MSILDINKRALPSFQQWIEQQSPGTQADGFNALTDLALRTSDSFTLKPTMSPDEASFSRMWMGALVAAVELCNMEALKHQRSEGQIIAMLPRVFAAATMYAIASALKDDAPFREVAKIVTEEFRAAAKVAADQLTEQSTSP